MFRDRNDAGRQLGEALAGYRGGDALVLGLPRGGVVVGFEVARALDAPLEPFVVRKIGAPHQPELGVGAVAEDGTVVADDELSALLGLSQPQLEALAAERLREVRSRVRRLRGGRPIAPPIHGRTVILVDDGLATGGTARAAVRAVRKRGPGKLVLAVPVAADEVADSLAKEVDELVCLERPLALTAVGFWYLDFRQVSDEEVIDHLERARALLAAEASAEPPGAG